MDILRKNLAPISSAAWEEINEESKELFESILSARKFVDFEGPGGWDLGSVSTGRLNIPKGQKGKLRYGINDVQPLVEPRADFQLDIWELDNAVRGLVDIDLDAMQKAGHEIAAFEEQVIYYGMKEANIKGLKASSEHKHLKSSKKSEEFLHTIAEGLSLFKNAGVEGPYALVVNEKKWEEIASNIDSGYPLKKQVADLIEGEIIFSPHIKDSFLVTQRGGDFRLTTGVDISIGYDYHEAKKVNLYFTESFTFEVYDPAAVVVIS